MKGVGLWMALAALAAFTAAMAAEEPNPQVPADYTAISEQVRTAGRDAVALAAVGDGKALYARFGAAMQAALSEQELQTGLDEIRAAAPIGPRLEEGIWPSHREYRGYQADHTWGDQVMTVTINFDLEGKIASMSQSPSAPQPPDPKADYATKTGLRLPFDGDWWVFWGGRCQLRNYHVIAPDQRHAYDLVVWKDGATFQGDGRRNEDYPAWGRPVLAPAAATVVSVRDGVRDNRPMVEFQNPSNPAGNQVVLDFGSGVYALIAHFQRGSLRVKPGDRVEKGQVFRRRRSSRFA